MTYPISPNPLILATAIAVQARRRADRAGQADYRPLNRLAAQVEREVRAMRVGQ